MEKTNYTFWILVVAIFSFAYLIFDKWILRLFKIKTDSVSYDSAKEAIGRLGTWTTWLTGLQTAAIAAMGLIIPKDGYINKTLIQDGFFALLFFGSSIVLATWLLSSLASVQQRLVDSETPSPSNDIYMMKIFSFIPLRLGRFTGLIHTYFLIGIVFFALFVFNKFDGS